jgi:hypothetical protein
MEKILFGFVNWIDELKIWKSIADDHSLGESLSNMVQLCILKIIEFTFTEDFLWFLQTNKRKQRSLLDVPVGFHSDTKLSFWEAIWCKAQKFNSSTDT